LEEERTSVAQGRKKEKRTKGDKKERRGKGRKIKEKRGRIGVKPNVSYHLKRNNNEKTQRDHFSTRNRGGGETLGQVADPRGER